VLALAIVAAVELAGEVGVLGLEAGDARWSEGNRSLSHPSPRSLQGFARQRADRCGPQIMGPGPDVEASRVRAKLTAITGARFPFPVLIVTPQDVQVPHGLSLPAGMEMLPFREFRARLRTAIIS
jgi:hypothetical protein